MHFVSSLLRVLLATKIFLEFLYGILLMLSRCCFHHLVENSILYKKDIQSFYIGPILFSENKIIRSVGDGKVDGQILFDTRSEKPKILFGAGVRNGKVYFVPNDSYEKFYLAVKWLIVKRRFGLVFYRHYINSCLLLFYYCIRSL